jgi:hypothetical protein
MRSAHDASVHTDAIMNRSNTGKTSLDDDANGYIIINGQTQQQLVDANPLKSLKSDGIIETISISQLKNESGSQINNLATLKSNDSRDSKSTTIQQTKIDLNHIFHETDSISSHNRSNSKFFFNLNIHY